MELPVGSPRPDFIFSEMSGHGEGWNYGAFLQCIGFLREVAPGLNVYCGLELSVDMTCVCSAFKHHDVASLWLTHFYDKTYSHIPFAMTGIFGISLSF